MTKQRQLSIKLCCCLVCIRTLKGYLAGSRYCCHGQRQHVVKCHFSASFSSLLRDSSWSASKPSLNRMQDCLVATCNMLIKRSTFVAPDSCPAVIGNPE